MMAARNIPSGEANNMAAVEAVAAEVAALAEQHGWAVVAEAARQMTTSPNPPEAAPANIPPSGEGDDRDNGAERIERVVENRPEFSAAPDEDGHGWAVVMTLTGHRRLTAAAGANGEAARRLAEERWPHRQQAQQAADEIIRRLAGQQ